jgi:glycosyltransferase involved in cell wall biosynthesis
VTSPERPLISILLLCYNQQDYVGEAVDGVLGQTYAPLEILIFDDCSPDMTANIIQARLAARQTLHNVRSIRNPNNLGATETVKKGLAMAEGRFVVMSAGDDVMLPRMVEKMADVWISENVSLVTTNAIYIDAQSKSLNRTFRDPDIAADDSFETLARDGANACCFGPAIGFEAELYARFGWVPPYVEGYDIMIPFYAYLLKGARFINEPLLKYRVHEQNTSLSLIAERSSDAKRSEAEERIHLNHLVHAVLMEEMLDRLRIEEPERYKSIADRILPLLAIHMAERSRKLVRERRTRIRA